MNSQAHPVAPDTRAGFTLIELLTVIAIIGILASILIPTLGKVKESASKTTCAGNLHQIAVGTLTYAGDNKGKLPARPASYPFPHSFVTADWNALMPYVGDHTKADLMYCPGALQEWRNPATPEYAADTGNYVTYSYFGNLALTAEVQTAFGLGGQSVLTGIKTTPAEITLWACLTYKNGSAYHGHSDPNTAQMVQGQNAVRADGSVRWVKGENLIPYFATNSTYYGPAAGH
ncbi:MAG TPA: type II secretion system protein [Rariglobus sp.]